MNDEAKKVESPNKEIDKAIKDLLKEVTDKKAELAPDEVRAKVAVITAAINWEKVKHHIRDDEEFDPSKV